MKKSSFLVATLLVAGIVSMVGAADTKTTTTATAEQPKASPGWVVIEEDVWFRFIDEPSHHMQQAHESFLKKDYKAAAHDLHLVGGHLYAAASTAVGDTKSVLVASAHEMDRLAKDVESGAVKSVKTLEGAFARAEHVLASHYHAKAKTAVASKQHTSAGTYLRSAVNHVENAAKWTGHELEAGAVATANGVRLVAGKLVEGTGFAVDEVGKGVNWVGSEVEKLGKVVEPHKTIASAPSTKK